jgi:hypothetical protein
VDFRQSLIDLRGAIDVTLKNWPAPSPAPPAQTGFFGRPLAPIGLNIADGTDWPVNSPMPNRAILEWAKSLGVNAVRVGFKIEAVQPTLGGALDPARIAEMKASLAIAAELGIAVLWDAHNYGRRPEGRWGYELPASDLANFWQRFAAAFTDRRAILAYGFMNEPPADHPSWPAVCQAGVKAIRAVDPTTLIMVPGRSPWTWNWDQINAGMDAVTGARLCFEAHQYPDSDSSGQFGFDYENQEFPRWTREMGSGKELDWLIHITRPYHDWLKAKGLRGILGETGIPTSCWYYENKWQPHWDARPGWIEMLRRYVTKAQADGVPVFLWTAGQHYRENKLVIPFDKPASVADPMQDMIRGLNATLPAIL